MKNLSHLGEFAVYWKVIVSFSLSGTERTRKRRCLQRVLEIFPFQTLLGGFEGIDRR